MTRSCPNGFMAPLGCGSSVPVPQLFTSQDDESLFVEWFGCELLPICRLDMDQHPKRSCQSARKVLGIAGITMARSCACEIYPTTSNHHIRTMTRLPLYPSPSGLFKRLSTWSSFAVFFFVLEPWRPLHTAMAV